LRLSDMASRLPSSSCTPPIVLSSKNLTVPDCGVLGLDRLGGGRPAPTAAPQRCSPLVTGRNHAAHNGIARYPCLGWLCHR
jgi:hypothetical protein